MDQISGSRPPLHDWIEAERAVRRTLTRICLTHAASLADTRSVDLGFDQRDLEFERYVQVDPGSIIRDTVSRIEAEGLIRRSLVTLEDLFALEVLKPTHTEHLVFSEPPPACFNVIRNLLTSVASGSRSLSDLDWREFEDLMAEVLEKAGWSIEPMGYTKDGGFDLLAVRRIEPGVPVEMIVQCKHSSNPIGIKVVRELWSVKWKQASHQAMIATTARFTKGAKQQAREWKMDLREHDEIVAWCKRLFMK